MFSYSDIVLSEAFALSSCACAMAPSRGSDLQSHVNRDVRKWILLHNKLIYSGDIYVNHT